jgi:hypothetical protein
LAGIADNTLQVCELLIVRNDHIKMRKLSREVTKLILITNDFGVSQQGRHFLMAIRQRSQFGQ